MLCSMKSKRNSVLDERVVWVFEEQNVAQPEKDQPREVSLKMLKWGCYGTKPH